MDGSLRFACVKGLEINNFAEDVNVTIHLQVGEQKPIASGVVDSQILKGMYEDPTVRIKPFDVVLMDESNKLIGTLKLHFTLELLQMPTQAVGILAQIPDSHQQVPKHEE